MEEDKVELRTVVLSRGKSATASTHDGTFITDTDIALEQVEVPVENILPRKSIFQSPIVSKPNTPDDAVARFQSAVENRVRRGIAKDQPSAKPPAEKHRELEHIVHDIVANALDNLENCEKLEELLQKLIIKVETKKEVIQRTNSLLRPEESTPPTVDPEQPKRSPTKLEVSEATQTKLDIQEQIITELAKKLDTLEKKCTALTLDNKERDVALQSKLDLLKIVQEKDQQLAKKQESKTEEPEMEENGSVLAREFLNETEILDAALQQFYKANPHLTLKKDRAPSLHPASSNRQPESPLLSPSAGTVLPKEHRQSWEDESDSHQLLNKESKQTIPLPEKTVQQRESLHVTEKTVQQRESLHGTERSMRDHGSWIEKAGQIISITNVYEKPTVLASGMKSEFKQDLDKIQKGRAKEVPNHGTPGPMATKNYHNKDMHELSHKTVHVVDKPLSTVVSKTKPLVAINNMEQAVMNLKSRLEETASYLFDCIDALAEEHRQSKRWKSEYKNTFEKLYKLKSAMEEEHRQYQSFLEKRQGIVNALLPIARPVLADQQRYSKQASNPPDVLIVQDQEGQDKKDEGLPIVRSSTPRKLQKVKIYIPRNIACYTATPMSIPSIPQPGFATTRSIPFPVAKKYIQKQCQ
ncbi:hypothetical protein EDD86DRAFT_248678 [Gorgonomyces haynaldii]|nr:hypothetical protein EDD86DRAFT_248678 [Gorgonomyces haynaldii]